MTPWKKNPRPVQPAPSYADTRTLGDPDDTDAPTTLGARIRPGCERCDPTYGDEVTDLTVRVERLEIAVAQLREQVAAITPLVRLR